MTYQGAFTDLAIPGGLISSYFKTERALHHFNELWDTLRKYVEREPKPRQVRDPGDCEEFPNKFAIVAKRSDNEALNGDDYFVFVADHIYSPQELKLAWHRSPIIFRANRDGLEVHWAGPQQLVIQCRGCQIAKAKRQRTAGPEWKHSRAIPEFPIEQTRRDLDCSLGKQSELNALSCGAQYL